MSSKTVFSPAGEPIEIVPDADWLAASGAAPQSLRTWFAAKPLIVEALWLHGKFTSQSGKATSDMAQWISKRHPEAKIPSQSGMSSLFLGEGNAAAFQRELNGKRTLAVQLVAMPETWYRKLLAQLASSETVEAPEAAQEPPEPSSEAVAAPEPSSEAVDGPEVTNWSEADWEALKLDAPTVFEEAPPLETYIAHQVAMELLTTVVEILSSGTADTTQLATGKRIADDLAHTQHLLSQRLTENESLRRNLREASDMITALRSERDGLRTRLKMTETNLQAALKGETAAAVNSEIHRRIDQVMRTAPKAKGD